MSPSTDPTLATLILDNVRGYAVLTLDPDGTITNWLGDARALTGYDRQEAVGRHFSLLFTEADRAAGTDRIELETAARLGRAEDAGISARTAPASGPTA
jgi:two-component system CheB/CheR fusion protein